ncbi:conjugal transfer protein [Candidatus Enterovibrio escicola]|uniref:conjugal transfer protein n=1 Tax=Candidatus Enterovibrio escicola TaxID=1927127 RepID=UPI001CC28A69|nr:conjugal transfer protein [Candidatus Enterovibrio escacola]
MRKSLLSVSLSAVVMSGLPITTFTVSPTAYAASDADCSIWLCLPTGFPSGCGVAKNAFKKRIKKFKSPLPNFSSCLLKGSPQSSTMTHKEGVAAKMPDGSYRNGQRCVFDVDSSGNIYPFTWRPYGCVDTWYYVDIYMDGQAYGEKFYYQR